MSEQFQRPHPNTVPCADCGHVWFERERRHQYVGEEDGEVSDLDDAIVVCILCHQKRRRPPPADDEVTYW